MHLKNPTVKSFGYEHNFLGLCTILHLIMVQTFHLIFPCAHDKLPMIYYDYFQEELSDGILYATEDEAALQVLLLNEDPGP